MAGLEPAASSLVPHLPALPTELHWLMFALPGGAILQGALPVFPGRQQYLGRLGRTGLLWAKVTPRSSGTPFPASA